jgi:hypothetical protein
MSDPDLDQQLREFLSVAKTELLGDHTIPKLHVKVDELSRTVRTVADGLTAHIQECVRTRESARALAASVDTRLVGLEAGKTRAPSLPPMRSREDSSHDLHAVADKITVAAIEGFKSPTKDAREEVAKVVDEIQQRRDEQRRLAELEALEAQRERDARDRRKFWRTILVAAVSGGGALTGLFEGLKGLAGHH